MHAHGDRRLVRSKRSLGHKPVVVPDIGEYFVEHEERLAPAAAPIGAGGTAGPYLDVTGGTGARPWCRGARRPRVNAGGGRRAGVPRGNGRPEGGAAGKRGAQREEACGAAARPSAGLTTARTRWTDRIASDAWRRDTMSGSRSKRLRASTRPMWRPRDA